MKKFNLRNIINEKKKNSKRLHAFVFRDCVLSNTVFKNCKFSNSEFWKVNFLKVSFINCSFNKTLFSDIDFLDCKFINCNFSKVNFSHSSIGKKIFFNCNLEDVNFNTVILNLKNYVPKNVYDNNRNSIITKLEKNKLIKTLDDKGFYFKKSKNKLQDNNVFFINYRHNLKETPKKFKNIDFNFDFKEKKFNLSTVIDELVYGNGYVVLNQKSKQKELINAIKKIPYKNKLLSKFTINKREKQFYLDNLFSIHESFSNILPKKKIFDKIESILGKNFTSGFYSANVLGPGARGQTFHIDYPYPTMEKISGKLINFTYKNPLNLQIQIMLTDINNAKGVGPTDIIPGTQLLQQDPKSLEIFENTKKKEIYFLNNKKKHRYKIKSLEGKSGTMVLFNGLAWHRAGDNLSKNSLRITLNMQLLSNYVRPMHKFTKIKKSKKKLINQLSGYDLIMPILV
jgi:hypothetical protein